MSLPSRIPGIVRSYDGDKRECRVEIPGMTDGADVFPIAEIEYPIGDKSKAAAHATEIEILDGDLVWLAFEGGDPRYPIITGYRNPGIGNSIGTRRWHHPSIELNGDGQVLVIAGDNCTIQTKNVIVQASESVLFSTPKGTFTGELEVQGLLTYKAGMVGKGGPEGASADIQGGIKNTGGSISSNGKDLEGHHHQEHDGPDTGPAL